MNVTGYDFCGYATKNDLLCSDGRTIRRNAFKQCDGKKVPLVYAHDHSDPFNVLGHAILENRDDGVFAYGFFNETDAGKQMKASVQHGDITALSIYANQLKQNGGDVIHGNIRELSLVIGGANPGAFIESVMKHGDLCEEEAVIYTGETFSLCHAESDEDENQNEEGANKMADNQKKPEGEETVEDVFNTLNEKQRTVVYALIGQAIEDATNKEGEDDMRHNVFEQDEQGTSATFLSHADQADIIENARRNRRSVKECFESYLDEHADELAHSIDTTGMETATGNQTYGFNDPDMLFPEARALNTTPEWIKRDTGWVSKVMNGVHRTPFSRIKSLFADITEDEARARGYVKGALKIDEVFSTLKRETTPQTVYKRQKLDRDDITDITDFDVVAWIKAEMRVMLDEEIARAILIGDGRLVTDPYKIQENHIRPVVTDVPLFNVTVKVTVPSDATDEEVAKATVKAVVRSRKDYKGSGNPSFWSTADTITEMLLIEDGIGHRMYKTDAELATALRVKDVVEVEPMEGYTVTINGTAYPLIGTTVNLTDYNVGADKGGAVSLFDDFDIDYNQQKYLIETRCSGALTKPYSAITFVLDRSGSPIHGNAQPAG